MKISNGELEHCVFASADKQASISPEVFSQHI